MKRIGNPCRRGTVLRKKNAIKRIHLTSDGKVAESAIPVRGEPISTSTDKEEVMIQ